jgi:GT2 family glycosyltransferase
MFSIICVYNNKKILDEWLLRSLSNQTEEFELILLDNTQKKYTSAAEALNSGGRLANNDYLLFVHQDIDFLVENWLQKAEEFLTLIPDVGIAGVAGTTKDGIISNIEHEDPPIPAGDIQNTLIQPVQTLDECVLFIPKSIFDRFQFDEEVCDDWHLYGVDYCLTAKKMGYEVYVLPMNLYHYSSGQSFSNSFFKVLNKLQEKWREDFRIIYTTSGNWMTFKPIYFQSQYYYIFFNYACDRYLMESSPFLWKFFKILSLFFIGILSKIGEALGLNEVGFTPYTQKIKLILKNGKIL